MTERCSVEWDTDPDDEDGDGQAEHRCYQDDGHEGDAHWCADHFACTPVAGAPVWFAEGYFEDPGAA